MPKLILKGFSIASRTIQGHRLRVIGYSEADRVIREASRRLASPGTVCCLANVYANCVGNLLLQGLTHSSIYASTILTEVALGLLLGPTLDKFLGDNFCFNPWLFVSLWPS